ncbi:MAG TPA: hypothetical protein VNZ48_05360 [Xanthobacteraceae bacterium]|jgi:hypothetical protein|nr:hypothetical protein [Xanthobacteraceae bacterium]
MHHDHWIPQWAANLPWWVKWAFMAGVGALSAFLPGVVAPNLQVIGASIGAALILVSIAGATGHTVNEHRAKQGKPRLKLEPSHLILLGLVIAAIGASWQMYRGPVQHAPLTQAEKDEITKPFRDEVKSLKDQLAQKPAVAVPGPVSASTAPEPTAVVPPPPKPRPYYSGSEIDDMLGQLGKMQKLTSAMFSEENGSLNRVRQQMITSVGITGPMILPSQAQQISDEILDYGNGLQAELTNLKKMPSEFPTVEPEIAPTIADKDEAARQYLGSIFAAVNVLRSIAKIQNDNAPTPAFMAKETQELFTATQNYRKWLQLSLDRIKSKTAEVRGWK